LYQREYDRFLVPGILRGIGGALADARPSLVALAVALHFVGLLITGERWRVVIAALGSRLRLHRTTLINLAGIFVRNATPTTGLGGDASRIALLRAEGVPLAQATASFAYVRLAEVPPLALVVALSAPAVATLAGRSKPALAAGAAAAALALAALWWARDRLHARAASIWARTAHLRIDRTAAALAVFYATLAQMETIARQIVVAAAFGVPLTIEQSATITAMTIVGGFVPTVGSIGAIDGSMVAGLMLFGAGADTAVAITIVGRAISYGLSTAAGAMALALLGGRSVVRAVTRTATDPGSAAI
jgi:glycosyltransferase 2 family protein